MKNYFAIFFSLTLIVSLGISCRNSRDFNLTKRHYTKGYYVRNHKTTPVKTKEAIVNLQSKELSVASAEKNNPIIAPYSETTSSIEQNSPEGKYIER